MSVLVNCSVCFDPLNPADGDVARTPCHHDYHVDCIDGYARNAFGSLTEHARCNRRDHTHDFTFEIPCPNCRHGLPYRVNLLAANSLLPNGDVVPNFPMEFDTVEVLNTSGIPIERPNPTPLQQEIAGAIRDVTTPADNPPFGVRIDFAEVRMQAHLLAYYERRQSLQPEVAPQPTLNRTHADDIENARILNHRLIAERLERERLACIEDTPPPTVNIPREEGFSICQMLWDFSPSSSHHFSISNVCFLLIIRALFSYSLGYELSRTITCEKNPCCQTSPSWRCIALLTRLFNSQVKDAKR